MRVGAANGVSWFASVSAAALGLFKRMQLKEVEIVCERCSASHVCHPHRCAFVRGDDDRGCHDHLAGTVMPVGTEKSGKAEVGRLAYWLGKIPLFQGHVIDESRLLAELK
jgi:hypothetical protein